MKITENEFTKMAQISEGIEESIFGPNESDLLFLKHVLNAGHLLAQSRMSSGKLWDIFRTHITKDATVHKNISRQVISVLSEDDFWNAFSEASLTVRDKAILAAINEKSRERIRKAYEKFSKELDEAREKMSTQLGKWENYSNANSKLLALTRGSMHHVALQINRAQLLKTISSTIRAYKALPGGRSNQRIDRQLKEFAKAWEKFLYDTLRRNLNVYNGEAFVLLKRLGSAAEENRTPPILAQRVKVGKGGTYRLIVRPDSYYEVWMLEPTTLLMGSTTFVSPAKRWKP